MIEKENSKSSINLKIIISVMLMIMAFSSITTKYMQTSDIFNLAALSNDEFLSNQNIERNKIELASNREETQTTSRSELTSRAETGRADSNIQESQNESQEELQNQSNTSQATEVENSLIDFSIKEVATAELLEVKETVQYISIDEVTISRNMDLTVRTGLSKEDFKTLINGVKQDTSGFFRENSDLIYDLCEKYQINEIFFCGLISAESGWNIASNHRKTHNYISLMSNGNLIYYSSVEEGLEVAAQKLHQNYLTPGGRFYSGKTLEAVKKRFCPVSPTWVDLVYGRMQQIV